MPTPVYKGVFMNETFVPVYKQNCPTGEEDEYFNSFGELHAEISEESTVLASILPFSANYSSDYVLGKASALSEVSEKLKALSPPTASLGRVAQHISMGVGDLDRSIEHIEAGRGVAGLVDLENALYHFSESAALYDFYCLVVAN